MELKLLVASSPIDSHEQEELLKVVQESSVRSLSNRSVVTTPTKVFKTPVKRQSTRKHYENLARPTTKTPAPNLQVKTPLRQKPRQHSTNFRRYLASNSISQQLSHSLSKRPTVRPLALPQSRATFAELAGGEQYYNTALLPPSRSECMGRLIKEREDGWS